MDLGRAYRIINRGEPAVDRDEWLDAYLTVMEDLHRKLTETLRRSRGDHSGTGDRDCLSR